MTCHTHLLPPPFSNKHGGSGWQGRRCNTSRDCKTVQLQRVRQNSAQLVTRILGGQVVTQGCDRHRAGSQTTNLVWGKRGNHLTIGALVILHLGRRKFENHAAAADTSCLSPALPSSFCMRELLTTGAWNLYIRASGRCLASSSDGGQKSG
jgi:hypothetical protein